MNDLKMNGLRQTGAASMLSLLTSSSTLICCTLPALLVALGAGSVLSSLITIVPQLVWFSEHKTAVFVFAAFMLTVSGYMQWRARQLSCPIDPQLAASCGSTRRMSLRVYLFSVGLFAIGGFFAFIAPLLNA